jgi:hypothetical protein
VLYMEIWMRQLACTRQVTSACIWRLEHPSSSSESKLNRQRIHVTKQPTTRNMGLSVVVCIQLPASAKQNRLLRRHIRNRPAEETNLDTSDGGWRCVRSFADQLARLGTRSRDADLARALAHPLTP